MKYILIALIAIVVSGCAQKECNSYVCKPTFCYQLDAVDQQPGKNCIGSGATN
ncbi:Uncharacterised protein [Yersinia intermedia]|nr:Uncharacterised protein [Yersinia intermedia]